MILLTKEQLRELVRDGATKAINHGEPGDPEVEITVGDAEPFDLMLAACLGMRDATRKG